MKKILVHLPTAACCCLPKELAWLERGRRPEVQVELEQQQAQPGRMSHVPARAGMLLEWGQPEVQVRSAGRMLLVLLMEQALMVWAQLESALPDSVSSGW